MFVPPPPLEVPECMGELELFLHDRRERTPALLKAALAHVQFESIHLSWMATADSAGSSSP